MSAISFGIARPHAALWTDHRHRGRGQDDNTLGSGAGTSMDRRMKFTAYEAMGIHPFVAHCPLVSWMYDFLSVRSLSTILRFIEIATAVLIARRSVSPWASAVGSIFAIGLFATRLSFLISTPGWEPSLGFRALSAMPGQFLLKDIVYLGASIWLLGESLKAADS